MANKELEGRVALVTGGGRGIGKHIALALAREGARLIICGRDAPSLVRTAKELALVTEVRFHTLDATEPEKVISLFQKIDRLDILVNNIGGLKQFLKFEDLHDAHWYEVFEVNLMSMVRFTRAAIPLLQASPAARIVNIASVAGKQPGDWNPHYGAIKAAAIHLSKSLARRLGPRRILVNAICSSTVKDSGMWERDIRNKAVMDGTTVEEAAKSIEATAKSRAPLGEICLPEDIAELVVFLASDKARFMTGTCIQVDGGTVSSIF